MIKLENISKIYTYDKSANHALKNINLSVPQGDIFGVIGKSGAGKSTLLRILNLLETPTTGKVIVDGQELTQLSPTQLRKARHNIGMIFQHFNLLNSATVYENIALPLILTGVDRKTIRSKVNHLVKIVGLEDRIHFYPSHLSGGQKQRVAIARAIACDPKVLLCDEATSALDPPSTKSILQLLRQINQLYGITMILITHEIEVIKQICQHVAVMEDGEIIEQSSVIDLFHHPQQAMTKHLIADSINKNLSERITRKLQVQQTPGSYPLIQISFGKNTTGHPIISGLIKKFGVELNILQANLEDIQQQPFGIMTLQVIAPTSQQHQIIEYLTHLDLQVEVLGYVNTNDL